MRVFAWASTDVGQRRHANEDSYLWAPDLGLVAVADGMGGHRGGEVASAVTVASVAQAWPGADLARVLEGVAIANEAVMDRAASDHRLGGMGTTLCAIVRVDEPEPRLVVVNVGDSRVYRYVDHELVQITQDHSLVETLVREGQLSPDQAAEHPQRNILTRAIGVNSPVEVDYWLMPIRPGERFVLCSDGLFNEVSDGELAEACMSIAEPEALVDALVEKANERGSRDNVTVVVVDVLEGEAGEPMPLPAPPHMAVPQISEPLDPMPDVDTEPGVAPVAVDELPPVPARPAEPRGETRRRVIARGVLFALVVVILLAAAGLLVAYYARANYFLGVTDGMVAVYQGRQSSVLWFDPTLEEVTEVEMVSLSSRGQAMVDDSPDFGSADDALAFLATLGTAASTAEAATDG
jgi:protein phosphatase